MSSNRCLTQSRLLPGTCLVDLFFSAKGALQIDLESVRQVQQVAQYIGKLLFQGQLLRAGLLVVETSVLAHGLRQLPYLLAEEQEFLRVAIFRPACFLADGVHIVLQVRQRWSLW